MTMYLSIRKFLFSFLLTYPFLSLTSNSECLKGLVTVDGEPLADLMTSARYLGDASKPGNRRTSSDGTLLAANAEPPTNPRPKKSKVPFFYV